MQAQLARRSLLTALFAAAPVHSKTLPQPDAAVHLLQRTSFGLTEESLARVRTIGVNAFIDEQLDPMQLDDSALDRVLAGLTTLTMTNAQIMRDYAGGDNQTRRIPQVELRNATVLRQIYSRRQLYEVMVEFWSNHFNVTHSEARARFYKTSDDRDVIRAHALGRFADLLHATARSPAMLGYLDNATNVVDGPNENYARELMELHTLGVDGGYTETDVKEVARCFTGWGIRNHEYYFYPGRHDYGAKQVLGHSLPANRGEEDGLAVLDLLATHPSTAHFIARKLLVRFVEDAPAASLVETVATVFRNSGGDIRVTVAAVLRSAEFRASADRKFKRPAEYVESSLRASAARIDGEGGLRPVTTALTEQGHAPLDWPAPNGYPDAQGYWLNTAALLARWNFVLALMQRGPNAPLYVDASALRGNANTPTALVDKLAQRLLHRPLAADARSLLIDYAAAGGDPSAPLPSSRLDDTTRELGALLLASPYSQYR
ncbi:MAG TPA: DUF1800 domain-containing protein [Tahibacter sp.]|uniref:DUF1800 domain-containing protein n=1 Tax=Tahibacter sp. TaxID=2056211 RepID=UPI002CA67132|nr:DUF1800 domain-containing protein [Tahibacter sp.]HSX63031.1 DUF1800 domain-containing protein [Tahibacter sp.]